MIRRGWIVLFGVLLLLIAALPAQAVTGDLRLSPRTPKLGEEVTVTFIIVNDGGTAVTYNLNLTVDGVSVASKTGFTVDAHSQKQDTMKITAPATAGKHEIELRGNGATLRVMEIQMGEEIQVSPIVYMIPVAAVIGLIGAIILALDVLKRDTGSDKMREISAAIAEGAKAFLKRQNTTIAIIAVILGVLLGGAYILTNSLAMGAMIAAAFLLGAFCSALSGYIGMYIAVRSNVRAAAASQKSFKDALTIALRGGAVSGLIIITMSMLGVYLLFMAYGYGSDVRNTPFLIVGYGFGASFVALFAQLGGGIFTKAADVGADLVGKLEEGFPEDDPRNPAVIADNVGDNVGDCAGRGADLFESTAAENIGAMILSVALFPYFGVNGILFPLVAIAFGIISSVIGVFAVRPREDEENPMRPLNMGFYVTIGLLLIFLFVANQFLLKGNMYFYAANVVGVFTSLVIIWITQYYTQWGYRPVDSIVESSKTGAGTNLITGFAVALETTGMTVITIAASLSIAFALGMLAAGSFVGITAWEGGLFGTAMVTIGMIAPAAYVLAMDTYGPITDNAGGINEMSGAPEEIRARTDRLDATGNTTKALTKGYAIGSAALAAFLLFSAFIDSVEFYKPWTLIAPGGDIPLVNLSNMGVFVGALVGAMLIFVFASLAIRAVGKAASAVIDEVRRQLRTIPGLREGKAKPEYGPCVDIVTKAALKEMVVPGLLVVITPVIIGVFFGVAAVAALLIVGTIVGILMATTLNNGGGAWDNAKKSIERQKKKGTPQHAAAVVGDTVGDPFKDTAGPSLHVVIKLLSTVNLVLAPLFLILGLKLLG
jgi:K(+)-stimulated pyrophosphate-energized sodium pump